MPVTFTNQPILNYPYAGPGDLGLGTVFAWWGLRAFSFNSVGTRAANLRVASATADFVTLSDGTLDVASIGAFQQANGGGSIFVTALYDQTGGGFHMTQAATAQQPQLMLNGLGARPVMTFNGSQALFTPQFGTTYNPPLSFAAVVRTAVATMPGGGLSPSLGGILVEGGVGVGLYFENGPNALQFDGGASQNIPISINTWYALQGIEPGGATDTIVVNGSATNWANSGSGTSWQFSTDFLGMGADVTFGGGGNAINGSITEGGVWFATFNPTQYGAINSNMRGYWGF